MEYKKKSKSRLIIVIPFVKSNCELHIDIQSLRIPFVEITKK